MVAMTPPLEGLVPVVTVIVPFKSVPLDTATAPPVPAPAPTAAVGVLPLPIMCVAAKVPATVNVWPEGTELLFKIALVKVGDEIAGPVFVTTRLPVPVCPVMAVPLFRTSPIVTKSQLADGPVTANPPTVVPLDVPTLLPITVEQGLELTKEKLFAFGSKFNLEKP